MTTLTTTKSLKDKNAEHTHGLEPEQTHRPTLSNPQSDILDLHRTVGNRAVMQSLQAGTATAGTIQAKLNVSRPGDRYEQEADRIADQVMRMPTPAVQRQPVPEEEEEEDETLQMKPLSGQITPLVQRETIDEEEDEEEEIALQRQPLTEEEEDEEELLQAKRADAQVPTVTSSVEAAVQSGRQGRGRPLDPATRAFMEPRLGHDFARVRVHTDSRAAVAAGAVGARAFTVDRDVFFGPGEFQPETPSGQHVLAHELTHTVQQGVTTPVRRQESRPSPPAVSHVAAHIARAPEGQSRSLTYYYDEDTDRHYYYDENTEEWMLWISTEEYTGWVPVPATEVVVSTDPMGPEPAPEPAGVELVDKLSHTYKDKLGEHFMSREEFELKRETFTAHVRKAAREREFFDLDVETGRVGGARIAKDVAGPARDLLIALRAHVKNHSELRRVEKSRIGSGYRTVEEQLTKWDASYWNKRQAFAPGVNAEDVDPNALADRIRGAGPIGGGLASPGRSKHQAGTAFDLSFSGPGIPPNKKKWKEPEGEVIDKWLAEHAAEFGFSRPVVGEPWHLVAK